MNAYIHTSLVGGSDAEQFNDINKLTNADGQLILDVNHPIVQITVSHGWIVDGLKLTYRVNIPGVQDVTVEHGTQKPNAKVITLKPTEVIVAIYGRAGYQDYYKRKLINSISFVIFDEKSVTSRVEGPFGNGNGSNNGDSFHVANVMAFGGYAKPASQCGLAGLSFYKNLTTE